MTWRTSKHVSRQGGVVRVWRGGGHKDSFVYVLASALAAAIEKKEKKKLRRRRWTMV